MKNRIYTALGDFCHLPSRDPTQRLSEDLGLDETDRILLLKTLEGELGVSLSAASTCPSRCRTVGDLFTLVLRSLPDADPYEITTISTP